jgi:hypothetical protein
MWNLHLDRFHNIFSDNVIPENIDDDNKMSPRQWRYIVLASKPISSPLIVFIGS